VAEGVHCRFSFFISHEFDSNFRIVHRRDDFRILGHLNHVYRRSLDENVSEAASIVSALADYYLDEGRRGRLTLEEAHAGLVFVPTPDFGSDFSKRDVMEPSFTPESARHLRQIVKLSFQPPEGWL